MRRLLFILVALLIALLWPRVANCQLAIQFGTPNPTIACTIPAGSLVTTLSLAGGIAGQAVTWSLAGDTADFAIVGNNLVTPSGISAPDCGQVNNVTVTATQGPSFTGGIQQLLLSHSAPPISITSATISCAPSCAYTSGAASGTSIGNATATLSSGTFTGTWNTSGVAAASFTFFGNGLQTNGATPTCTSATPLNLNVVASQGGATKTQAITVTCNPSGGPTPPPGAVAAGFTTLALSLDFQTNQACIGSTCVAANNLANWLDAAGASPPQWCMGSFSAVKNVILKQDPIYNIPVLDLQFLAADFNRTTAPFVIQTQIDTQCNSGGPSGNFLLPVMNVYAEATMRNDVSGYSACPTSAGQTTYFQGASCFLGVFWSFAPNFAQSGPFFEWDFMESAGGIQSCGANPCIDGGIAHPDNGATYNNGGNNTFQEPGQVAHDPTQFNTYAWRNTSNSSGQLTSCSYLGANGGAVVGIGCTGVGSYTPVPVPHNFLTIENGPQGGSAPIGDEHAYFKSVHIWSCATWQTTECFTTPLTTN